MKKRFLLAFLFFICGILLVGCATTKATDVFRFEVRELKLTLYADTTNNKEKALKLIRGDTDKNATIVYTVSYIDGEKAGIVDMNNGILEVKGSGTNDKGYVTTTGVDDVVKIVPLSEGKVRFSAYVQGKENVADSIIITVEKEIMSGFQLIANSGEILVEGTGGFTTKTIPSYLDNSVLRYEVSDETIATITEVGTIKGVKPGTVTVKAYSKYDPTIYATATVRVVYADAGYVDVYDLDEELVEERTLENGDTLIVSAEVRAKATGVKKESVNQTVTYESSDKSVCTVTLNEDGTATFNAVGGGEAVITVSSADKKAKATIDITVNWGVTEELCLKEDELNVAVDKTVKIERTEIKPANANKDVNVKLKEEADGEYISISGTEIKGLKPGTAYVIVESIETDEANKKSQEVKINVAYDTIEAINIQGTEFSIQEDDPKFGEANEYVVKLAWKLKPTGANPGVTLVSDNTEVAEVDEEGNLTIKNKQGEATITITSTDNPEVKAEYKVYVTAKPTSFTVEWPEEDGYVFTYSDNLEVVITVNILPENADQESFNVEIESNDPNCYVDYETSGNKITLVFDPDSLGEFDVIINVPGVDGEEDRVYTIKAPENND